MLHVEHLTKKYGKFLAVSDFSFDVSDGDTAILLGPNGAGKTTVMRAILGLIKFKGKILVNGTDVLTDEVHARSMMGFVPQQFSMPQFNSVAEQARFVGKLKGVDMQKIIEMLKDKGLWELRDRKIHSLSSGMKQKFAIAMALANDPPLLLFDEPISNIDWKGQIEFNSILRRLSESRKTILIATHLAGISELANQAIILNKGTLVAAGPPQSLLEELGSPEMLDIKVPPNEVQKVVDALSRMGVDRPYLDGPWIRTRVPPQAKVKIVKELLNSIDIQDVRIQPTIIEADYFNLIGRKTNS